jgi:hypothetical protein
VAVKDLVPSLSANGDRLTFDLLPGDLKPGRYTVTIQLGQAAVAVPGELVIAKRAEAPPATAPPLAAALPVALEAVRPVSPYPNSEHKNLYDFEIAGTNFAKDIKDNHVEINKVPIDVVYKIEKEGKLVCSDDYAKPCLSSETGSETRKLVLDGFDPEKYTHPLLVRVRVGDQNVSGEKSVTFSRISERAVKLWSIVAFGILIGVIYFMVRKGIRLGKIDGESYGALHAFLIDKETNSYSLSKFQLTLFTLVAVFGYIYVFVCRMLVQWNFELPPVPEGLPGMLAVSAGTTVVAAGIAANVGGKGAGPTSPSPADFISSGGVVLPERFQFFLWTIISSFGLLALILASDPTTVETLPKLPDGMLYLMGLSSAGYLGGKLVRGPGPSVISVDAKRVNAQGVAAADGKTLALTLTGDNLSSKASFRLDDEHIPATHVEIDQAVRAGEDPARRKTLNVKLNDVAELYYDGPHLVQIINPDMQAADAKYGATITSGDIIMQEGAAAGARVKISVKGTSFTDPSSGSWKADAAGSVAIDIPVADIFKKSDTELEVTLPANAAGPGILTIKSPGNLITSVKVTLP